MAFLPTNASQVQQFAGALYGIKVGSTTMAAVQADITSIGGLSKALNAYYAVSFGSQTTAAVAASVAANLGLTGAAATDGAAYITAALNAAPATARGQVISDILNLFSTLTSNATYGAAATAWNEKVAAAVAYNGVADAVAGATVAGGVFSLTTGADILSPTSSTAATQTTSGDDSIYATVADSLTTGDVIDGGAGTDTLTANLATAATVTPVVSNVEVIKVTDTSSGAASGTYTLSNASITGVNSIVFSASDTAADTLATSGIKSASTQVGISGSTGAAHIYTFAFADAALAGAADKVTLNVTGATTATGTVSVASTGVAGGGAETISIVTSGTGSSAASTIGTLASTKGDGTTANNTQGTSTLEVSGTSNLTVTNAFNFAGTTSGTVTATGMSGNLNLNLTNGEAINFNAAGAAGNMTIATTTGNDSLVGGNGDDTFTPSSGFDTIVGGAGNDRVVLTAITELTSNDSVSLGDGTRDTLAIGTWTSLTSTELTTANKALIAATGAEVLELTAAQGAATTIDFGAAAQSVVRLSGGLAAATGNSVVSNAVTGSTLIVTSDMTAKTGAAALTASGALPSQTFKLELFGTGVDILPVATAATDSALELSSGIATLAIDSTKAATDTATTANTIGGTGNAAGYAIKNTSASSVVITGNHDLTINNSAGATFSAAVSVDASAFTGALTIAGSASADVITGGTGNDVITGGAGNDVIDLSKGGADKLVFSATNNKDTVTGFSSNDKINIAALGDGTTGSLTSVISSAGAQAAITDDTSYIINTSGAAANLTTLGTATVTDWTSAAQVYAYIAERFTSAANTEAVLVINDTTTSKSYVWNLVDANGTLAAADFSLVGVITRDTALDTANVVFA